MNINFDIIKKNQLFANIDYDDLQSILCCTKAKVLEFEKDDFIFKQNDEHTQIGIIQKGEIAIIKEDKNGNRNIINKFNAPMMFGEAFACIEDAKINVSVIALTKCEILMLDFNLIIQRCSQNCSFHTKLVENMLSILASKIIFLNNRLEITAKRSIREKLLAYFEKSSFENNSNKFILTLNREQLADFLFVDRSSMSRELSKMQADGIIKYNKNEIEML